MQRVTSDEGKGVRKLQPGDIAGLLGAPKLAILATTFADGTSLLSPVWHGWRDGGFTILIASNDVKARHIRRDPRVSVVVADDKPPYAGIEVRGRATLTPADDPLVLRRIAVRYLGETLGDEFTNLIDITTQAVLRIEPSVVRIWDFADEDIYK
jgi:PPOX class probable F420-dependent enzyme